MNSAQRHYPVSGMFLLGPFILSLLGALFCGWSAWGNGLSLCITSGCSLYQDYKVWGVSMWWIGVSAFFVLAVLALIGRPLLGYLTSAFGLLIDIILLMLMLLTAPCAACLIAGIFFALVYVSFRLHARGRPQIAGRYLLLPIWAILFFVNVGSIVKAEVGQFPMYGDENSPVRMYFSPSCPSCRDGVAALSGQSNVAFYPVAEDESDLMTIATMIEMLENGSNMAEAMKEVQIRPLTTSAGFAELLYLRFKLLCNKAHIMAAGSQVVPFFEFHGLPKFLAGNSKNGTPKPQSPPKPKLPEVPKSTDYHMPVDMGISGGCGDEQLPCTPGQ